MKAYDLNTRFTFGKYEGKTLDEVFQQDPEYVEKCMMTVEDFAVDEKSIQKLFEKYPDVDISDGAIDTNLDKLDQMDDDDDDLFDDEEDSYDEEDLDEFDDEIVGGKKGKGGDDFDDFADDDLFEEDKYGEEDFDDDFR
jgi:hypothetical protein